MLMGAFFGDLRRRPARLVVPRPAGRRWRPAACWRSSTRSSRSTLRADQIVSGIALNFLALGITGYLFLDHYGDQGTPDNIPRVPDVSIPGDQEPLVLRRRDRPREPADVGRADRSSSLLTVFLFRTPRGLRLRSVGENPRAAETVGHLGPRARATSPSSRRAMLAAHGRRLPVDRLRRLVQPEHDRGARASSRWRRSSSASGARSARSAPRCCSASRTALAQRLPAFSPSSRRRCSRRCPTCSR